MKDFLQKLAVGGCLALALSYGLSRVYERTVLAESDLGLVQSQLQEPEVPIRRLFVGDSHVRRGVVAQRIEGAFNFAALGESYALTYYKLKDALDDPTVSGRVETVILSADLHSFSGYRAGRITNAAYYRPMIDLSEAATRTGLYLEYYSLAPRSAFFAYAGSGLDLLRHLRRIATRTHRARPSAGAFEAHPGRFIESPDRSEEAETRALAHFGQGQPFDESMFEYFLRSIALIQEKGLRAVVVSYPVTREYAAAASELLAEDPDRRVEAALEGLDGVTWLRYRETYFDRPQLFADPDHLNLAGAIVLAAQLAEALD